MAKILAKIMKYGIIIKIMNKDGFKFFFYSNEHEPKHIHVMKGNEFAKINLEDLQVRFSSFKNKDLSFILETVKKHRLEFERRWNEYFS
ncbi:hypothetical protein HpCK101_32730 [Helicobacter pylori]